MRARIIVYSVLILILVLLQSIIFDYLKLNGVKPNFLLVLIVSASLLRGSIEGAVIGFCVGMTQDILSGRILGFYALLGLYLGLACGVMNKRLYRENIIVIFFFTFCATMIYEFIVFFFGIFIWTNSSILFAFQNIIIPETLYNVLVSPFVYIIILRFSDKFEVWERSARKY